MLFCNHEWEKLSNKPTTTYLDYSGFKIGIFLCKCKKCGKIRQKKYW